MLVLIIVTVLQFWQLRFKAAFIMYEMVGGRRFFGGFQNFMVKIEGVSKFCRTQWEGSDLFGNDKP